jgi:hypothetical protein
MAADLKAALPRRHLLLRRWDSQADHSGSLVQRRQQPLGRRLTRHRNLARRQPRVRRLAQRRGPHLDRRHVRLRSLSPSRRPASMETRGATTSARANTSTTRLLRSAITSIAFRASGRARTATSKNAPTIPSAIQAVARDHARTTAAIVDRFTLTDTRARNAAGAKRQVGPRHSAFGHRRPITWLRRWIWAGGRVEVG